MTTPSEIEMTLVERLAALKYPHHQPYADPVNEMVDKCIAIAKAHEAAKAPVSAMDIADKLEIWPGDVRNVLSAAGVRWV